MTAACCEDGVIIHDGEDFKNVTEQISLALPTSIDIDQPAVEIAEIIPTAQVASTQYFDYDPPLRSCDLTVVHQVFLI